MVSALLLIGMALVAYQNSLSAPFIFDDYGTIVGNTAIASLWPARGVTTSMRPLVHLTLAVNYAIGGFRPWGYHLVNLAIHTLAGLTLLGVVRRTLHLPALRSRYGQAASGLALAVALLWTIHPLQTSSVTYLIQRSESLMGLCYLLTLYCVIRTATTQAQPHWTILAVVCCALGMGSKPVMVTAPLMVLCYDRIFLSCSWRQLIRQRRGLSLGLMATWGVLAACLLWDTGHSKATFGAGLQVTPLDYVATQPGVVLQYLKLALWPQSLCLDYGWPVARTAEAILVPTVTVGLLIAATGWALWRFPKIGFLGFWFFGILAPTSTVFPLADAAMEHRMYLPLASVIILVVLGGYAAISQLPVSRESLRRRLGAGLIVICAVALTAGTIRRNVDYRSQLAMWNDVVTKRPENARGHLYLGNALDARGRLQEAAAHFLEALRLRPGYAKAHLNLGNALTKQGQLDEAAAHFLEALRLEGDFLQAHVGLGVVLSRQGRLDEAIDQFEKALRIDPDFALTHNNLGSVFLKQGRLDEAMAEFTKAIRLDPSLANAHLNMGRALRQQGNGVEARTFLAEAVRLQPGDASAHYEYGLALAMEGVLDQARQHLEEAVILQPEFPAAQYNLGITLFQQGRLELAEHYLSEALRQNPGFTDARLGLDELRRRRQTK